MSKVKLAREARTPMYLHLPTALKRKVAQVAEQQKCREREVVVAALNMYVAYVTTQPAPAVTAETGA